MLPGSSAAIVAGYALSDWTYEYSFDSFDGSSYNEMNLTPFYVGLGVSGAMWLYGVIDASSAAKRTNRERGLLSSMEVAPIPVVRNGKVTPGIAMRASF